MANELIQKLRKIPGASLNAGISSADLASVQAAAGLSLPEDLVTFYHEIDGCDFEDQRLQFLSVAEGDKLRRLLESAGLKRSWCYWPLTENNDSNPICICCAGELRGYVVQVFHDNSPQIKWRSFNSFLTATIDYVEADEWCLEFMNFEFQNQKRTGRDVEVAFSLARQSRLRLAGDPERDDLCRFASWLFGNDHVSEIAKLLESENEYVQRDICDRLKLMPGTAAAEVLKQHKNEISKFVTQCAELLTAAGLHVIVDQHTQLHVMDGPVCLNMEMFYSERDRSDFDNFLVERARYLVKSHRERNAR